MFCGIKQMSNYVGVLGNQVFFAMGAKRYKCKNNEVNLNTLNPEFEWEVPL